jgi:hypothetical protein
MGSLLKTLAAGALGLAALGFSAASAEHDERYRPDRCTIDHDHRAHDRNYYDYYDQDRYYRGDPSGASFSISIGGRGGRYDDDYRYGYGDRYRPRSRVVRKNEVHTRYGAHVQIIEEIYYTRSGRNQLVCTVRAKSRDAHEVSYRELRRIAERYCSRRASIRIGSRYW